MFELQSIPQSAGVSHDHDAMFGSVLGVYEQHGYESGYRRAVLDVGLSLLELTEDLISRRGLSGSVAADLRRAVLALQEDLHRGTARWGSGDSGTVEGGLGI